MEETGDIFNYSVLEFQNNTQSTSRVKKAPSSHCVNET